MSKVCSLNKYSPLVVWEKWKWKAIVAKRWNNYRVVQVVVHNPQQVQVMPPLRWRVVAGRSHSLRQKRAVISSTIMRRKCTQIQKTHINVVEDSTNLNTNTVEMHQKSVNVNWQVGSGWRTNPDEGEFPSCSLGRSLTHLHRSGHRFTNTNMFTNPQIQIHKYKYVYKSTNPDTHRPMQWTQKSRDMWCNATDLLDHFQRVTFCFQDVLDQGDIYGWQGPTCWRVFANDIRKA